MIGELHAYAVAGAGAIQPRLGVLFRQVNATDREGITHRLVERFGAASLLDQLASFGVADDYHYVIDSGCIAHVCNRHADAQVEQQHGHAPVDRADFERVPLAVRPRNIVSFERTKRMPPIVYEDAAAADELLIVLELQHVRKWLVMRTM